MARIFEDKELVLATHNKGKVREISELLKPYIPKFYSASDLDLPEPEETGITFIENAELKARAAALTSGKPALADDSGFEVEALGGDPGIYSARWAGPDKDFDLAMRKVHEALEGKEKKIARFVCVLSLCWPDGHCESFEGRVHGAVSWPPSGDKGFGYDPIFIPKGHDQTFAQMEPSQKHAISHRAQAFGKLVQNCFEFDKTR